MNKQQLASKIWAGANELRGKLSLVYLKKHGLRGNLQGPCRVPVELQAYIDLVIN